jgi:glycosyltransferase involved in cell wall biosynthesis
LDAYERELRHLAETLGIAARVDFRGHQDDITREFEDFDVLVHASIVPEPFGQVVVEGMSAQLPVVASRAGGPAEIITDGVDGLLYPTGDTVALSEILGELAASPELRGRLAEAAHRRAQDFAPAVIAQQIEDVYALAARWPAATTPS